MGYQLGSFAQTMQQQQEEEEEEYRTGQHGLQMLSETDLKNDNQCQIKQKARNPYHVIRTREWFQRKDVFEVYNNIKFCFMYINK